MLCVCLGALQAGVGAGGWVGGGCGGGGARAGWAQQPLRTELLAGYLIWFVGRRRSVRVAGFVVDRGLGDVTCSSTRISVIAATKITHPANIPLHPTVPIKLHVLVHERRMD